MRAAPKSWSKYTTNTHTKALDLGLTPSIIECLNDFEGKNKVILVRIPTLLDKPGSKVILQ